MGSGWGLLLMLETPCQLIAAPSGQVDTKALPSIDAPMVE
jgi:hypothetical protein